MREEAGRVDDPWLMSDGSAAIAEEDIDPTVELALLSYAQRSAARSGAEWFAAEFQRREDEEQRQRELADWPDPAAATGQDVGLVDASVENDLIGGAPTGLGFGRPPLLEPIHEEPEPEAPVEVDVDPESEPEPEPEPEPEQDPEPKPEPEPEPAAVVTTIEPEPLPAPKPSVWDLPPLVSPTTAAEETESLRHPHVPRPPRVDVAPEPKKRWRRRDRDLHTPVERAPFISAPEWARMSPGARKLYGLEERPPA